MYIRRTWFLERVLKLGVVHVAKEFQCVGLHLHPHRSTLLTIFSAQPVLIHQHALVSWTRSGASRIMLCFGSVSGSSYSRYIAGYNSILRSPQVLANPPWCSVIFACLKASAHLFNSHISVVKPLPKPSLRLVSIQQTGCLWLHILMPQ